MQAKQTEFFPVELKVRHDVASNLNDTDFQTIHSLMRLIDL